MLPTLQKLFNLNLARDSSSLPILTVEANECILSAKMSRWRLLHRASPSVFPPTRSQVLWIGVFYCLLILLFVLGLAFLLRTLEQGELNQGLLLGTGLLFVTVLGAIVGARSVDRWIIQPIDGVHVTPPQLEKETPAVAQEPTRADQVAQLNKTVDELGLQLKEREDQIASQTRALEASQARYEVLAHDRKEVEEALLELNAGLEKHVQERTAALEQAQAQVVAARARLEQLLAAAPAVVYSCPVTDEFVTTFITENVYDVLGFRPSQFTSQSTFWRDHLHPDDRQQLADTFRHLQQQDELNLEYRFLHSDGSYRWLSDTVRIVRNEYGLALEMVGSFMDITRHKQTEQALQESQERYELAVRGSNEGLWDWNLETNRIYYSPRWKSMLGYNEDEIGDTIGEWYNRVHLEDLPVLQADLTAHLRGQTTHFENEHRVLHADGSYRWVSTHGLGVFRENGQCYRIVGSQSDITRRKEAEERLIYDALHEPLTGLPNRALFMDRLTQALKRGKQETSRLAAVLVIDLDRFKVVTDSLGHLQGDQLLVQVAERLETALRPTDTVARLGGDEFAILLDPVAAATEAAEVANWIQDSLLTPFRLNSHEVALHASIGIALTRVRPSERLATTAADVLRNADTAMNRAKAMGGGRTQLFDDSMHAHALALLQLDADLRQALDRGEFQVYYQPIFSLARGRSAGAEALIRWQHPQRGLVLPDKFIDVAEETGLIAPIGEWMFRTACAQAQTWRTEHDPGLQIAVNFSGLQFQNPKLAESVARVLAETGLPATGLKIEITETTIMQDLALSRRILHELDEIGVEIAIDDFGNRYSALGQLKWLPVKILKIDQSFLRAVPHDLNNSALTIAIMAMARSLDLRVIAEGVETPEQFRFLSEHGCDEIQGFLYSRALPADDLSRLWPTLTAKLKQLGR